MFKTPGLSNLTNVVKPNAPLPLATSSPQINSTNLTCSKIRKRLLLKHDPNLGHVYFIKSCLVRQKSAKPQEFGLEIGEGDATNQKSMKKSAFSLNEGKAFSE